MKLIASLQTQKDKEIARLKQELESAHAENARLKAAAAENALHPRGKLLTRKDSEYGISRSSSRASSTTAAPSYARSTVASVSRVQRVENAPSPKIHAENDVPLPLPQSSIKYHDGCIVEEHTAENTSYLRHTISSAEKTLDPSAARAQRQGWCSTEILSALDGIETTSEDKLSSGRLEMVKERLEELESDPDEMQRIEETTRLRDTSFYNTQAGKVQIPVDDQMRFLRGALRLAQETLHDACRERWPRAWLRYYVHGPETVKFGRDELESSVCSESGSINSCGFGLAPYTVAMLPVVYLRNAVAHPSVRSTGNVDDLMENAHNLACVFRDERCASQIRRLRDEMQEVAKESFQQIIDYEPWSHLPERRRWAVHHQLFFHEVNTRSVPLKTNVVKYTGLPSSGLQGLGSFNTSV